MNRRELLKAVAVMSVSGKLAAKTFKLEPSAKYVAFYDPMLVGPDFGRDFIALHPNAVAYPVHVPLDKTLDDGIRLFEQHNH